jgi:ABC-type transport system involved in multi-copper enzyme maturation permease subunit
LNKITNAVKHNFKSIGLPLLAKELTELAARPRTYLMRGFAAISAALLFALFTAVLLPSALGLLGKGAIIFNVVFGVEWILICLFIPAVVSDTIAREKERQTLDLLFLTRLGPWTILLEKLLSRFVTVGTILLAFLPPLTMAYAFGGMTWHTISGALIALAVTAFEVGGVALYCSARCRTVTRAFVLAFIIEGLLFLGPALIFVMLRIFIPNYWEIWISPQQVQTLSQLFMCIDITALVRMAPSFRTGASVLVWPCAVGVVFLIRARRALARQIGVEVQQKRKRTRQTLGIATQAVDSRPSRLPFVRWLRPLPVDRPIAWLDLRQGILGNPDRPILQLLLVGVPTVMILLILRHDVAARHYRPMSWTPWPTFFLLNNVLWFIAIALTVVRTAGLVAVERNRQTFDLLVTTPLSLRQIIKDKFAPVRSTALLAIIPLATVALSRVIYEIPVSQGEWLFGPHPSGDPVRTDPIGYLTCAALSVAIYFPLVAYLTFYLSLRLQSQVRTVIVTFVIIFIWCLLPVVLRVNLYIYHRQFWSLLGAGSLFLAVDNLAALSGPASIIAMNEYQDFRLERWSFPGILTVNFGVYAAIALWLRHVALRNAARVLVRPGEVASWRVLRLRRRPFAERPRLNASSVEACGPAAPAAE